MTRWLTSSEAAVLLNYKSAKTLNAAIRPQGIPHKYVGGRLAFDPERLEAWRQTHHPKKRGPKPRAVAA